MVADKVGVKQYRRGLGNLSPGFDLLAPCPTAESGANLVIIHALMVHSVCLPRPLQVMTLQNFSRPASIPGRQLVGDVFAQRANCSNSSSAHILQRCWPRWGWYEDVGLPAREPTDTGQVTDLNYNIHVLHSQFICQVVMLDSCVQTLGPTGCFLFMYDSKVTKPGRVNAALSAPSAEGGGVPLEIVLPCVLGGILLVAIVVVVLLLFGCHRRGRLTHLLHPQRHKEQAHTRDLALDSVPPADAAAEVGKAGRALAAKSCESLPLAQSNGSTELACSRDDPAAPHKGENSSSRVATAATGNSGVVPDAPVIVTPFTPHRSDLKLLDVQCDTEVQLLPVVRGQGNFGRVVEGLYGGGRVAVKLVPDVSQWSGAPRNALQMYVQEVEVLGRCRHPNVVNLLAACLTPPRLCLVMELMETSLDRLIHELTPEPPRPQQQQQEQEQQELRGQAQTGDDGEEREQKQEQVDEQASSGVERAESQQSDSQPHDEVADRKTPRRLLPMETVLHIGVEVARALDYLHPTIVHRDLKPANVLLNDAFGPKPVVKLTDFGLSRLRSTAQVTKHPEAGTPSYMAPELYDITNAVVTDKSDMYSLGVLLWEMCSGQVPWSGCDALVVAYAITINRNRLPMAAIPPERRPLQLQKLIQRLWDHDPLRRPAAAEVAKQLTLLQMELARQVGEEPSAGAKEAEAPAPAAGEPATAMAASEPAVEAPGP